MRPTGYRLLTGLWLCLPFAPMTAEAETTYYDRSAEGWYWYRDPPAEPEEEEPAPPPPPVPAEPPAKVVAMEPEVAPLPAPAPPMAPEPASAPPTPGSVAFLREAMPAALDLATNDPTPENVERYLLLQKIALDRSEQFSEVAALVAAGHPELDEGRRRPRQDAFAKALDEQAEDGKRDVLARLFQSNALIMFVDRNCSSCGLMGENFFRMGQTHGLVWQAISMDGTLLPEDMAPTQSFDAGLSDRLGVANGGAVFLASPPNTYIPVTWNPTGGTEIADRVLMVARRAGLISEGEFRSTQPVAPMTGTTAPVASGSLPPILAEADALLRSTAISSSGP